VLGSEVTRGGERLADRVDGERRDMQAADDTIGERKNAASTQVLADKILDESMDRSGTQSMYASGGRSDRVSHPALVRQLFRIVDASLLDLQLLL
jgi:hypothetical protein